ncbi:MAG: hypothetical protein KKI08_20715 [Armatimonadetes bacterium]|nr:hypothetical protein [Armatimonadota bacterium]
MGMISGKVTAAPECYPVTLHFHHGNPSDPGAPGAATATTDSAGRFAVYLAAGQYKVSLSCRREPSPHWACPAILPMSPATHVVNLSCPLAAPKKAAPKKAAPKKAAPKKAAPKKAAPKKAARKKAVPKKK